MMRFPPRQGSGGELRRLLNAAVGTGQRRCCHTPTGLLLFSLLLFAAAIAASGSADDALLIVEKHIKSCLGDHCGNLKTAVNNKARVGLLAPPASGMEVVWSVLRSVRLANGFIVPKASKKRRPGSEAVVETTSPGGEPQLSVGADVDLLLSTHVPPYGYGRNHGWTKIVRLYRDVADHAYSVLAPATNGAVDTALVDAQTRLLVRWHCRLSHVAAHTKMLSGTFTTSSFPFSGSSCHFHKAISRPPPSVCGRLGAAARGGIGASVVLRRRERGPHGRGRRRRRPRRGPLGPRIPALANPGRGERQTGGGRRGGVGVADVGPLATLAVPRFSPDLRHGYQPGPGPGRAAGAAARARRVRGQLQRPERHLLGEV